MDQILMMTASKTMQNITKIVLFAQPIQLMGKLRTFLFSEGFEWADSNGHIDMKKNYAQNSFLVFKQETNLFFDYVTNFTYSKNIFFLNVLSKEHMEEHEKIFEIKNKKTRHLLKTIKEEYQLHKAQKNFFEMIHCIKTTQQIVSGKIKFR